MASDRPISPAPAHGARGDGLPAYLSNGVLGLRVREDPLRAGMCIVSGFAGEHHERRIEAAAPAPYPLGLDVALDGLWASDQPGSVEPLDQAYDFETAELTTRARLRVGERSAVVETVAFCSRTHPTVVAERVTLTVEGACDVRLRARLDPDGVRGAMAERRLDTPGEPQPVCDGAILWRSEGELGALGMALSTRAYFEAERTQEPWDERGPLSTTYAARATRGRPLRLDRLVSLIPDAMHGQPQRQAVRLVVNAAEVGFDALRARNREAWADIWRGRIRLEGADERWQARADAALFYLTTSTHRSSPASTSIFGLATWRDYHHYFGHVMWDVDAFAVPPLTLLQPEAARSLLEFRSRTLPAARANARMQGRAGLQFPWEAGMRHGEEASPGGGDAAAREIHVSLHVARGFAQHADATGDARFLEEQAWPVLAGVSEWIVDRASPAPGGRFRFLELGGIAENPGFIDEDAVTTLLGRQVLRDATRAAERLGRPASPRWAEVAEGLEPPLRADGAIASHAGFRLDEPKGATPSPLMALFPYWAEVGEATARRTLDLYLAQWRDYVGSPMLAALYGAWAAWAGDRDLSLTLLEEGYGLYETGRFAQILEYRTDKIGGVKAGPFVANMGGFLTGLLFGLPGLKVGDGDPRRWPQRPVVLPKGWEAVSCERLWIRGEPWRLRATHGAERAELTPA